MMASLDPSFGGKTGQPMLKSTTSEKSWTTVINSNMAGGIRWKKGWLFALAGLIIIMLVIYLTSMSSKTSIQSTSIFQEEGQSQFSPHVNWFWVRGYTVWPEFSNKPVVTNEYFRSRCAKNADFSITGLPKFVKEWENSDDYVCRNLYSTFDAIFSVEARKAHLSLPETFKTKVSGWLGNKEDLMKELYDQDVIHMVSKFTREHTIFNPLRDKRPVSPPETPEKKYVDDIVNKTAATCDFCKFKQMTAQHLFGRIESQYAFSASNVFKIDSLHALIALKTHHPLEWNYDQFLDLMGLSNTWLKKAKTHHPKGLYPSLTWDILPHCGASQVHPHVHIMFDPSRYHGVVESWREGAQDYYNSFGTNYFTDLTGIYSTLGLAVPYGNATVFANLVPKKDHEVVVMAKEANKDFFSLLFYTLRAFLDDKHVFCYSMGLGYPALGKKEGKIPAYARVITRGPVTDIRADMSSLELFTAGNVNIDPWKTIQLVRDSIQKRADTR